MNQLCDIIQSGDLPACRQYFETNTLLSLSRDEQVKQLLDLAMRTGDLKLFQYILFELDQIYDIKCDNLLHLDLNYALSHNLNEIITHVMLTITNIAPDYNEDFSAKLTNCRENIKNDHLLSMLDSTLIILA